MGNGGSGSCSQCAICEPWRLPVTWSQVIAGACRVPRTPHPAVKPVPKPRRPGSCHRAAAKPFDPIGSKNTGRIANRIPGHHPPKTPQTLHARSSVAERNWALDVLREEQHKTPPRYPTRLRIGELPLHDLLERVDAERLSTSEYQSAPRTGTTTDENPQAPIAVHAKAGVVVGIDVIPPLSWTMLGRGARGRR